MAIWSLVEVVPDNVPFTDIHVDEDTVDAVAEVLRSKRYVKGDRLRAFEDAFAEKCSVEHAVGVSSGTAALQLGMRSLGVGEGDEVFVPGNTFFATASSVLSLDAKPVFVDVDPETYTMDPEELRAAVREANNPTAVAPVHIYGQLADMAAIRDVADDYGMTIIEDACQAHFASRDGFLAGAGGDVGAFSFYPSKNMTVAGDGGMLVTDRDEVAEHARALRNHGRAPDGTHEHLGLNYRLDETNAVVGHEQLAHIDDWNQGRRDAARAYTERLADVPEVETPTEAPDVEHAYHLYVVQVPDRDALREHLADHGIETGIHYETPAHEHRAVVDAVGETTLPETEALVDDIVSLPMHPRLDDDEIEYVSETIEAYYE